MMATMNLILQLRIAEIQHFCTTYQMFKTVFATGALWMAAQFVMMSLKAEGTLPIKSLVFDLEKIMSDASAHRLIHLCAKEGFIELVETSDRRTQGARLTEKGAEVVELILGTKKQFMDKKGVVIDPSRARVA